jgi:non-heme chloroperoxidase
VTRARRAALAVAAAGATVLAGRLAQDAALRRWERNPDPLAGHDRLLAGEPVWVDAEDGARIGAVVVTPTDGAASDRPTVVLAHGFTGNRNNWTAVATLLAARGRRVVAYDQRGHGTSTAGSAGFALPVLGADLAAVVAALAPDGAVLVGHSMGGVGIQALLAHHPERLGAVRGVVLVATLARTLEGRLVRVMGRAGTHAVARTVMANRRWGRIMCRGAFGRVPFAAGLDIVRAGWVDSPDETRAGFAAALGEFDLSADLERVRLPAGVTVTVVCGDRDGVTPLEENRRLAGLLGAELQVLPGIGHEVPLEVPVRLAEVIDGA